ncbi:hypothetical protein INR49_023273 [Caranx melampygus]|nr:hypothetical protein INR49_023273 [Caranx melampygus]
MVSSISHLLCSTCLARSRSHSRGDGTGGATHQKGDVRKESGSAIIPAAAPACPGGIRDPGLLLTKGGAPCHPQDRCKLWVPPSHHTPHPAEFCPHQVAPPPASPSPGVVLRRKTRLCPHP